MIIFRLIIVFLFIHGAAHGQHTTYNAKVQYLGVHDGLSDGFITSLIKTNENELWVGTRDGLNRFDGFRFHEYNTINSNLNSSSILKMVLVGGNKLVVQTKVPGTVYQSSGLYIYARNRDDFISFEEIYGILPFSSDKVKMIQNNRQKLIALEKEGGGWMFNFESSTWEEIITPPGYENINEYLFVALEQNYPTARKLLSPDFGSFFGISRFTESFVYNPYHQIQWVGAKRELYGVNKNESLISFSSGGQTLTFPREIRTIEDDENGLIYVGTENGLYVVSVEPTLFQTYLSLTHDSISPANFESSCRGLCVVDSILYVNQINGLYSQSLRSEKSVQVIPSSERLFPLTLYDDKYLFFGRNNFMRLTLETGQVDTIYHTKTFGLYPLWSLLIKDELYYLGTHQGIVVMDSASLYAGHARFTCGSDTSSLPRRVYYFHDFRDGRIAYLTSNGFYIKNKAECDPVLITFKYKNGSPASFTQFSHVLEERNNTLWLTTLDGGIIQCELQDSVGIIEKQLNRDSGSPTNTFYAIYGDAHHGKWISSDLGLMHLREDWTYRMYTVDDGLPSNEFNRISHYKTPQGDIYFGGLNGVIGFNPEEFYQLKSTAPNLKVLHVNQFSGWEDKIVDITKEVDSTGKINFLSGDKFFEVQIGLNDFFDTKNHKYEYRFANLNENWEPMNKNLLRVNVLPFGQHTLEFRGQNASGVYSTRILSFDIHAVRPFYLTWWFFALIALGVLLIFREFLLQRARRIKGLEKVVRERTHELEKKAEALRISQAARSRFFANVSHELRTPLTLIKAPIQRLLSSPDLTEKDKRYLDIVQDSSKALHDRIDDLLSLSQADAGQLKVHQNKFRLSVFLDRLIDSFAGVAIENKITLRAAYSTPASLIIQADQRKIWQVLSNYIANAMKFSEASSVVTVACFVEDQNLIFSIEDQGRGISKEDLTKVFDRFYQTSGSDHSSGGIGLGLALSKELAHAMKGRVWAKSKVGRGSTFFLEIPFVETDTEGEHLRVEEEKIRVKETLADERTTSATAAMIMLVEDNASMRTFLMSELNMYHVEPYADGRAALDALLEKKKQSLLPDLIISDVMMPVMNGFEMLTHIKRDDGLSGIPVIMLTARVGAEDKLRGLRIGVDDYITKPFNTEELIVRIKNLISRNPIKQEASREEPSTSIVDNEWLEHVETMIKQSMGQRNYTIAQLALELHISERQLHRKLKSYTGLSPNKYLREVRLCHAKDLLESQKVSTVAMLSAAIGFEDPDYFSRLYYERWGHRPSECLKH